MCIRDSSNTTVIGSLNVTNGGLNVSGTSNLTGTTVAGSLNVSGISILENTIESTSINSGALQVLGGVGIAKNLNVSGNSVLSNTTVIGSLNVTNGGLNVSGTSNLTGTTVTGSLNVTNGGLNVSGTSNLTDTTVAGSLNVSGISILENTSESTSTNLGALQVLGGVGIAKRLNVGGSTILNATIGSTSTSTGALQVLGGVGVKGNVSAIGYNVSVTPMCNINTSGFHIPMGTTVSTTIPFQIQWAASPVIIAVSYPFSVRPIGYSVTMDSGAAISGTATAVNMSISVTTTAGVAYTTVTPNIMTVNTSAAQFATGLFTTTTTIAANTQIQMRFSFTLVSGTMTVNPKTLIGTLFMAQV